MSTASEPAQSKMSLKCRHCGWSSSTTGTNGKAMLANLEAAHSLLRPECPTAKPVPGGTS